MKQLLAALIAATFAVVSVGAIAAKHEGAMKKDEKKDKRDKDKEKEKKDEAADEDDDLTGDERNRIAEILADRPEDEPQQKKFGKGTKGGGFGGKGAGDYRNFSPDKKLYAFIKNHNLYVAEALNHCIRKVNLKTGIITTVAGSGKRGYSSSARVTFSPPMRSATRL